MTAAYVCESGALRAALRDDLDRYVLIVQTQHGAAGPLVPLRAWLLSQGLWATTAYRLTHYARYHRHSRLLGVLPFFFHLIAIAVTGINIEARAHIGPVLRIPHGRYIVIGPVRIGGNCEIFQGVTLGQSADTLEHRHSRSPVPTLLVRDVPPRGVVLGVPARLVSRRGSFAQIMYREMYEDEERKRALAEDPDTVPGGHGSHGPELGQRDVTHD